MIVFGFPPDWSQPVKQKYQWLTDVIVSYDGTEQRRQLRSLPRVSWQYRMWFSGREKRRFEHWIHAHQSKVVELPIWPDPCRLTVAANIGETILAVDNTVDRAFVIDGGAVLIVGPTTYEWVLVTAITPTTITVTPPLTAAWPVTTLIYPTQSVRLHSEISTTRRNAWITEMDIAFDSYGGVAGAGVESGDLYRGLPLYLNSPNWVEDLTLEFHRKIDLLEHETGFDYLHDESGASNSVLQMNWLFAKRPWIPGDGRFHRQAFVRWLYARSGKFNPVWMPTHNSDLIASRMIASAASSIHIEHVDYAQLIAQAINRRDFLLRTLSGSQQAKRITASVAVSADEEQLTVSPAGFGQTIQPDAIAKISYLQWMRLATDEVEISHQSCEVAECTTTFMTVPDDV